MNATELKKQHVEKLACIRSLAKAGLSDDAKNGFRMGAAIAINAIESTWEQIDPNQLWTSFEPNLTDTMRIGEHIAKTRNSIGLVA